MGCAGGVPQQQYDSVNAQLRDSQAQVSELQSEVRELENQKASVSAELEASQEEVVRLQGQIGGLKEHYELVGKTPAETAENIVRYYHETHTYSIQDFYVCSDMAADVWNMLKAQGIGALIQIGNVKTGVSKITDCDHAWVLAEVSSGDYLALETTGGSVIQKGENALYYKGWSFNNPKDLKRYQELRREYNIRVDIINQLVSAANEVFAEHEKEYDYYKELVDEFNTKYAGHPVSTESKVHEARIEAQLAMAEEKEDRYKQLGELIKQQKEEAAKMEAEWSLLATER
ncbi:hypothetical protein ACFLU9_00125 [Chloroflexota bacterium]